MDTNNELDDFLAMMSDDDEEDSFVTCKEAMDRTNATVDETFASAVSDLDRRDEDEDSLRNSSLDASTENVMSSTLHPQASSTLVPLDFGTIVTHEGPNDDAVSNVRRQLALDSDSDEDEEMFDKQHLNSSGKYIQKTIARRDHMSLMSQAIPSAATSQGRSQSSSRPSVLTGLSDSKSSTAVATGPSTSVFDAFFKINIRNPKFSSLAFDTVTEGMKKIRVSSLRLNMKEEDNWVTMGVIVERSEPKKSANGNEFMIWRVHDLLNCQDNSVKVLLFGEACKEYWKLQAGNTVALVTAQLAEQAAGATQHAKDKGVVTLKVSKKAQIMDLGFCSSYSICKGVRNDAQKCTNFVNTELSEFCVFHVMNEARKLSSKRGVFSSVSGLPVKRPTHVPRQPPGLMTVTRSALPAVNTSLNASGTMKVAGGMALKASTSMTTTKEAEKEKLGQIISSRAHLFGAKNLMRVTTPTDFNLGNAEEKRPKHTSMGDFMKERVSEAIKADEIRAPTLGFGLRSGGDINLATGPVRAKTAGQDAARLRAIAILKKNKDAKSPVDSAKKGSKRYHADDDGPPIEKRLKLGSIDNKEMLDSLMKRKSINDKQADKAESEAAQKYLDGMEKKERVETFMTDCMSMKNVKVVTCYDCSYTAQKQSELCAQNGHTVFNSSAEKRFFKCKACHKRTVAFGLLPTKPCTNCEASDWERVGLKDEKKITLENERLQLRGEERKNLYARFGPTNVHQLIHPYRIYCVPLLILAYGLNITKFFVMRSTWIDVLYPLSGVELSRVGGDNPARDSLRAILSLALFALTFFAAMLATVLRGEWARGKVASFIACIGGGVFLATCLLDLLPEALESFEKAGIETSFPVAECAVAAGLLMVLTLEHLALAAQERGYLGSSHIRMHDHDGDEESGHQGHSHSHSMEGADSESMLGAALLVLALSMHALFEGLSLAVISDASKLLQVFAALIIHKCIIGFSLGVRLVQSGMRTPWVALCALCFSIQVLIGGIGGITIMALISGGKRSTAAIVSSVLQGIACGTFLYITTFEVVPHEMAKRGNRLTKLGFLFVGFIIVICFMLILPESDYYSGWLASTVCSLLFRFPIHVGAVRLGRLRCLVFTDVRLRLPRGVSLHADTCSLQLFPQQVSKPLLVSLGDVRIEADTQLAGKDDGGAAAVSPVRLSSTSAGGSALSALERALSLTQYCGLSVTSVHLVLLEAVPDCMIHVTVDELSLETFRSRDGWQVELSSRLAQGKALRRRGAAGRPLADFAMPFQLSVDVESSRLKRIGLRIADPAITLSSGIFEVIQEHQQRMAEAPVKAADAGKSTPPLQFLRHITSISIDINNSTIKYNGSADHSRCLCLSVRETVVEKRDGVTDCRVAGMSLADQMMRSAVRTSQLTIGVQHSDAALELRLSTDSVQTTLSLQDTLWWKNHFDEALRAVRPLSEVPPSPGAPTTSISVWCSLEVASLVCQLVDQDSFQSTISVQYLSFSKTATDIECGVESFCLAAPGMDTTAASFDIHQWGHSVYVGVALVQYTPDETNPKLLICVDDLKVEWSDRLAQQVHQLLLSVHSYQPMPSKKRPEPRRKLTIKANAKRASVFSVARESTFLLCLCDEFAMEATTDPFEIAMSAKRTKIGIGRVKGKSMALDVLRLTEKSLPHPDEEPTSGYRQWNQKERDRLKHEKRKLYEQKRSRNITLIGESDTMCVSLECLTPATRDVTISSNAAVYIAWSPLLHRVIWHMKQIAASTFTLPKKPNTVRTIPRVLQLKVLTNHPVELDLELPRYHRMLWRIPSLTLDIASSGFSALSPQLNVVMNGYDIVTAVGICITRRLSDQQMDSWRRGFGGLETISNKVWTWSADSFHFYLPFEFNFHAVFDEFINTIKWLKVVHGTTKKPFTADSPLPADIRIVFKEARLEMEDDPFENLLQTNHELKEDEVYECERRRQMLAERLVILKKQNPLFAQSKMDELHASLLERNGAIYIERWKKAGNVKRSLFVSQWTGWEMRAFADVTLHGTDACTHMMHEYDPLSFFPTDGLQFSTLWGRGVEMDMAEWNVQFKDYPMPYILTKDMHFFGTLVGAEQFEAGGRSLRESTVDLPAPWETHTVLRNMSPLKFYYDMQCESREFTATYGPCWEPCLSMISLSWNNISAPSRDPSPPLPFWDKMRFLLHGRFSWLSNKMVTTMLASPDPYNTTETVEMCWDEYGLDWAQGEMRIRCGFRVFMRTASRYDDSRILLLPDLRLRVALDWICGGDPHDHHSVTLCSPQKLPHYSTDHDSYRAFRSQSLDLVFSFDVASGAGNGTEGASRGGDATPHVLLYANTFRCIDFLINTLTMKNRIIKRGRLFGTPTILKPQLSKHFRNVQVSVNLPRFYITYWMSHSSDFGFRVSSDGLSLLATLRLAMSLGNDSEITRRRTYSWTPQHVSATLWGTQVHVYGNGRTPHADGEQSEDSLLLGISRVSYVRENSAARENAVHRLTAHDLRASWTAEIRDACLSIADGVHRAHLLRRILSNDAIKILKLHMEEERERLASPLDTSASKEQFSDDKGHRRGYSLSDTNQSMLNQLIDEASTKLIAHCEQATDLPTDSLQGVLQCTSDDALMINWQIDLLNSQVVLKGCERDGFVLLTAARASLTQKVHKCVWRSGQLLGKKSWSSVISGMQYFAPVGMSSGLNKSSFRWLPREAIEERPHDADDDFLANVIASGEAVGGVVQPDTPSGDRDRLQLQRIVSRCSCQIYFCYFSEELKTDALEETGVPKLEPESSLGADDSGVDCLTLKHNMLEASTSSDQYEMVVDIVNNLVLFVDPKKKELAEHRRRLRFECQMSDMAQMRDSIVEQQSQLRDIVSVVRSLERQLFYLDMEAEAEKRNDIVDEMEEYKHRQLEVSDRLAIYISCYKQRQVESARAVVHRVEEDGLAAVARRFEVCFEDCIWRLTEQDGQIALAETQIRNFLYTRTMRIDNSGEHLFEVGSIRVTNLIPTTLYRDTLHRDERVQTIQPAIRLVLRDMAPVGGICVKEHFEVNICPMVAQLTYRFFEKMMGFFFPGKNIHKDENLEAVDENAPKFSFTRRIAGTLSMRSNKSIGMERKASSASGKTLSKLQPESELNDIEKMRQRADKNNFFLYIKIPEVPFVVSYKGNKEKNLEDVDRFSFLFPLCEFHERNWTWLDVALAVKQRCKRVLVQQFMRQKLLRNRLTGATQEPVDGISEEEKKRIALGTTSTMEKKKKK